MSILEPRIIWTVHQPYPSLFRQMLFLWALQELDRRILELKAAHARETARGLVDAAAAPLGSHGGAGAAPPSLEFGDLAASALELAQQVHGGDCAHCPR